ncbi:MAG: alpha/beta fold hydrolase [Candidatus Poribacteria bacterium]
MPKAFVNGINIHYQTSGQGPDLVLIHGATGNMAFWYLSTLPILKEEFRVTVYDMRGHGYSDVPPSGYTSADMAKDLVGLLDHLGIERAHLLGHSFGGVVALHTAALYEARVANLVLADPEIPALRHLCDVKKWPYWEAWNARLREFGIDVPDEKWDDLDYVLRQSLYIPMAYGMRKGRERKGKRLLRLLDNTTAINDFRELAGLTMDKIRQIPHPTLAIYGELSPFLPACQYLTENMPNCKSVIVPTGHFHPALEPEEFVKHLKNFLRDPENFAPTQQPKPQEDNASAFAPTYTQQNILENLQPIKFQRKAIRDKKILLVAPDFPQLFHSHYELMMKLPFDKFKSVLAPLSIATIAALTPDDIQVDIWDEAIYGRTTEETELLNYDFVLVIGDTAHQKRALQIAEIFHKRKIPIAIGGAGVSLSPERYRGVFDVLFIGEMELTWPQFIADFKAGNHRKEYRQITLPDFNPSAPQQVEDKESPPPRWDSLEDDIKYYFAGAVQTTRGVPSEAMRASDCEFYDSVEGMPNEMKVRGKRQKPISSVLEEVAELSRLGFGHIFFTDDNFIANPQYTKELLDRLAKENRAKEKPIRFSAQAEIDVAKDEEMLSLLAEANFLSLFTSIDIPNFSLTDNYHSAKKALVADCKKVQSYGLLIRASFVVGFDHDTNETFDELFDFVAEANILFPSPSMLRATPGTKLWRRLKKEGRLLSIDEESIYVRRMATTNIVPKRMTRVQLMSSFMNLVERLADWDNFVERVKGFLSDIDSDKYKAPRAKYWTQAEIDNAMRALLAFVDNDARRAIGSLLKYTSEHTPFMLERILNIAAQGYGYIAFAQSLREMIRKQIQLEK